MRGKMFFYIKKCIIKDKNNMFYHNYHIVNIAIISSVKW